MRIRGLVAALTFAALCLSGQIDLAGARAQQSTGSIVVNQVDGTAYPDLRVVATALDANALPVAGLTEFRAFEGDRPLAVQDVQAARDEGLGLSVVIVIDTSGSMQGEAIVAAKQAAAEFVQSIGPNDEAAVVTFAADVRTAVPFTRDKAALAAGIDGLQALGATALFEAVQTSTYSAFLRESPRRAVVLLSDGQNESPAPATADGSIDAARGAKLPVYAIGFGSLIDAPYLQRLATVTGGEYVAASTGNVGAVYGRIADVLRSQYVVTLRADDRADGELASLRLQATINGVDVESASASFVRGEAPAEEPQLAVATPAVVQPAQDVVGGNATNAAGIIAAVVLGSLALVAGTAWFMRWRRAGTVRRAQLRTVAPNPRLASAQGVPEPLANAQAAAADTSTGRLVLMSSNGNEHAVAFGAEPVSIGSGPDASIHLADAGDVAAHHALVWMKDGRIMLRHVGGVGRRTLVDGRPVEWVILEDGDAFTIGSARYRVERITQNGSEPQPGG